MSAKDDYDVYVLAQTWLPSFCCSKPKRCPQFLNHAEAWAGTHFVLHGLWPSKSNGTWPSECESKFNSLPAAEIAKQVPPLAEKISPSLKQSPEFAMHEWKKHGSCAKLASPEQYFSESLRAHIGVPGKQMDRGTPKLLVDNAGKSVSSSALRDNYYHKVGLKCFRNSCVLQEVVTCYERRADNNKAGKQVDCPPAILNMNNSCGKCKDIYLNLLGQCTAESKSSKPDALAEPVQEQS